MRMSEECCHNNPLTSRRTDIINSLINLPFALFRRLPSSADPKAKLPTTSTSTAVRGFLILRTIPNSLIALSVFSLGTEKIHPR